MEKPEHWEPWWDEERIDRRHAGKSARDHLLMGIGFLLSLIVMALFVVGDPISISEWTLLGFLGSGALFFFVLLIGAIRNPPGLIIEGVRLLLPQGRIRKLEPVAIDLRRYERAELYADHWPEPRLNRLKSWFGWPGASRAPYKEKWVFLLSAGEVPSRVGRHPTIDLADVRMPTRQALALLNYRIAKAANSQEPLPDFEAIDRRTPPPGISIIGRLPHDTAWWDANELGIEIARQRLVPWIVLAVLMCGIMIPQIVFPLTRASLIEQWEFVFYGAFGVMALFGAGYLLLHKHALIVSRNALKRRVLPLHGLNVPRELPLADFHDASPTTRLVNDDEFCDGVQINEREYDAYAPTHRVIGTLLKVDPSVLPPLLTYRIAKAKGENPPPPEFS